jgi:thioredoxin reductase (NADPH)
MSSPTPRGQTRPALVVIDDHESSRAIVANTLRRRFGSDYEVVAASPREARTKLEEMRSAGADVALIVANQYLDSDPGTALLAATRDVYPTARRLVLGAFGDNRVMPSIARASTLGEIDHVAYMPWTETDESFMAAVGNILAQWAIENGRGDARMTIVGQRDDPTFHLLGEVLQRWQTYPVSMLAADTPESKAFLTEHDIDGPLPIVALSDGNVVTGADVAKVSDFVGAGVDTTGTTFDVAIVGLGPAGFSAAVNAGSEGMRVILINSTFSQASSSPKVWNYLGFPDGVTGAELMRRAWEHALMFGAVGRIGRTATGIRRQGQHNVVMLDDGSEVVSEVVMLAIGVDYRRIGVESVDRLIGSGVFYGYSAADALALSGLGVAVVGGANSAVQAAISLARDGRPVHLIVRGDAPDASDYLTEQVDALPNVTVHLRTTGDSSDLAVSGLFIMIGAVPRTEWLPRELARDDRGYVLTGDDGPRPLGPEEFRLPFETTVPGVFALGDVRSGSVKRVAAAVGEGSAAVQQVMRYRTRIAERAHAQSEQAAGEPIPVGASHT